MVARSELRALGISARAIQYRVETGRLEPLHRGVYGAGPVVHSRRNEVAALLACGRDAWLGYWTAAGMWELTVSPAARAVAIITRRDLRLRDAGLRVFRVRTLHDDEVTELDGLPITTPARTLLDLASVADAGVVERALHRAVPRIVARDEILALLERYPRRQGRGRLRGLLDASAPGVTRSEAERAFLRLLRSGGVRPPETNVILEGYEVDCLWRVQRLVVEVDGRAYHSDALSFERDRERDAALVGAGFRVMRVTWKQIDTQPRRLLVRVAAALARGEE